MMQAVFIAILDAFVAFVESAFHAKSFNGYEEKDFFNSSRSHSSGGTSHHHPDDKSGEEDVMLKEAYRFMEIEPPASMEEARKQWKKLSLRYHPDRNGGSEESHALQQKLNTAFNRIQEALEGIGGDLEEEDDCANAETTETTVTTTNESQAEPEAAQRSPQNRWADQNARSFSKKQRKKARSSRKKQREKNRRRQEQLHREMRAEMEEERRRMQLQQQKLRKEQDKIRRETSRLSDFEQREAASRLFMNLVQSEVEKRYQSKETSAIRQGTKPKYFVMEACTCSLVVAMRLGMETFALDLINQQIALSVYEKMRNYHYMARVERAHGHGTGKYLNQVALTEILGQRLDDDGNALLHYAVYWERPIILQIIFELSQEYSCLPQVFLLKNVHGYTAMDLATIAINPSIMPLMKFHETLVINHLERTELWPAIKKTRKRLWSGMKKADPITTANSALGFCVARYGFRVHWVVAVLGIIFLQVPSEAERGKGLCADPISDATSLLGFLAYSKVSLLVLWQVLHWSLLSEFLLIMCPFFLLCCRAMLVMQGILQVLGYVTLLISIPFRGMEAQIRAWQPERIRQRPGLVQTYVLMNTLGFLWVVQAGARYFQ